MTLTTEEFVDRAKRKHGELYDYSNTAYISTSQQVTIQCRIHGLFHQKAHSHIAGAGCPVCAAEKRKRGLQQSNANKLLTTAEFVRRAIATHGDRYDYSNTTYCNWKTKVMIVCPVHGEFTQSPGKHIDPTHPTGCPRCAHKQQTTDDFVKKSIMAHGTRYDYTNTKYTNDTTKVVITCKQHGDFTQIPSNHHSLGHGCPTCKHEAASRRATGGYNTNTINPTDTGILYCVHVTHQTGSYIKVGITTRTVTARIRDIGSTTIQVLRETKGLLLDLYLKEQAILHELHPHRYRIRFNNKRFNGWTECFNVEHTNVVLETFDDMTASGNFGELPSC